MLLLIALIILIFSAHPIVGYKIQIISVSLINIHAIIYGHKLINYAKNEFSSMNGIIIWIAPLISWIVGAVKGDDQIMLYSGAMFLTCWSLAIIGKIHKPGNLIGIYLIATLISAIIIFGIEYQNLFISLASPSTEDGLFRFSPLGLHPNLVGHIFGGSLTISLILIVKEQSIYLKIYLFIIAIFSIIYILAASTRGGLFASIAAVLITILVYYYRELKFSNIIYGTAIIIILGFVLFSKSNFFSTIGNLLDFNSESRGLDAGFSGRIDAWPVVISLIINSPSTFLWGNGYRSWDSVKMGFDIDNSFINLIYEIGFIITICIVWIIIRRITTLAKDNNSLSAVYFSILLFALIEGIVSRYLIGIGNATSLFVLIALLSNQDLSLDFLSENSYDHSIYQTIFDFHPFSDI
jgi:hypothetical protein